MKRQETHEALVAVIMEEDLFTPRDRPGYSCLPKIMLNPDLFADDKSKVRKSNFSDKSLQFSKYLVQVPFLFAIWS